MEINGDVYFVKGVLFIIYSREDMKCLLYLIKINTSSYTMAKNYGRFMSFVVLIQMAAICVNAPVVNLMDQTEKFERDNNHLVTSNWLVSLNAKYLICLGRKLDVVETCDNELALMGLRASALNRRVFSGTKESKLKV